MGENGGYAEPGEPWLNGLLPGANLVMRSLDEERWVKAEERVAELIACIQPNQLSEERRNAVADYVQQLIMKCIPSQVCRFGSVPLKTYLPDGDIDLTAISHNQNPNDTWAKQVRDMLESEENNENAEFHVKEVQYIQAEVKIIKCLVENIVVDISFNQVGGLCTLCFLDEVDSLINQNHLFKRSIILIKAWCYYESRILGAHHGLISTYALETLVLYIFHVFNNSFNGPLEVLYRFLAFFSNFDWDNFCVSLWGPVPITSLPDVTAQPPRRDSGELLLSKVFLEACSSVYAAMPGGQENNGQLFVSKHFNVIDPLRVSNNLGRSVSKGNFFRIRSAFAFGAKKLAKLLDCPKESLIDQVNQFFMNTWDRHGSGHRPDAPGIDSVRLRLPTPDKSQEFGSSNNNKTDSNNNKEEKIVSHANAKNLSRTAPMTSGLKSQTGVNNQIERGHTNPVQVIFSDKIQKDLVNDTQGRLLFARTHSSPELTDNYIDVSSQVQRNRRMDNAEAKQKKIAFESLPRNSTQKSPDFSADSGSIISYSYQCDLGLEGLSDEFSALSGAHQMMNQEEQDILNMIPSSSLQSFNGQRRQHAPFNLMSGHLPYSIPPSFLASMGYTQRNFPGFVPANVPFMDPSFSHVQFPHGLVSPQLTRYFPNSLSEDSVEMNSVEADSDFWKEQDVGPSGGYVIENGNLNILQSVDNNPPPLRVSGSSSGARVHENHTREKRGAVRENNENLIREVCVEDKPPSSRLSSASRSNSLRSQTSSESSWDGSSVRISKSTKDKRGNKISSIDITASREKGKIRSEHDSDDDDDRKQHNMPGYEVAQTSGSDSMTPFSPMLINPGSRHIPKDNSGMIAFYPTGPPIPFLTMLPLYNVPSETGTSDASSGHFGGDETLDNSEFTPKGNDFLGDLSTSGFLRSSATGISEGQKYDILSSDFASHWHNLQFGRFCQTQNSRQQGSLLYPSPVMVPPVYFQGQIPYDSPTRPLSTNTNLFSQLVTSHGHHMVPVAPVQPVSSRHPNVYHSYTDDMPRFRGGTGTYLPNPKVPVRDRHSSSSRRGNYNHDRNDTFGDRENNWNSNPKSRGASRNHRSQSDNKINSRNDRFTQGEGRSWNSNRRNSATPSYQVQNNGPLRSGSSQNGPQIASYGMYSNGVSNGTSGLPVVMMYPYDRNGSQNEQLEFGSLGPVGFAGANERTQLSDGARGRTLEDNRLHGSSGNRSSPERPSSPRNQRRA